MTETFIPPYIQESIDMLVKHCEHKPEVERLDTGWRLTMRSERVVMTMDFRRAGGRRSWKYHSTLTVDGVRRPLVHDIKHFAVVWRDPDLINASRDASIAQTLKPFEPPAVVPVEPAAAVPALIEKNYRDLARQLPEGAQIVLGCTHETWQIMATVTAPGGRLAQLYLAFIAATAGHYTSKGTSLMLGIDGLDYTDAYEGTASDILAMLLSSDPPEKTGSKPIGTPRAAAVTNSVNVRKATVIRT